MSVATPLVFRPSPAQRGMCALLCAGSWLVGVRALAGLVQHLPRLRWALRAAEAASEPTALLWLLLVGTLAVCALAGLLLLGSLLGFLMVEGSNVLVDELGITVEHGALPGPLARRLGAGRLVWKRVSAVERRGPCFVIRGGGERDSASSLLDPTLRFILVDELERLVLLILERSPNVRFDD